ncbi:MAG: MMPL family transporter [Tetrasphaera jenkinsii]|jgi:RND superfamily putative drug exporter|nr:MMPL family transporter [Tetrasphaera jenkinsii]
MAQFLYRLGRWCADRAGRVLALWLALLIAVGGAAASFGTPMTSKFSLPGSDFQRVLDQLGTEIPELSGGFGTVVFESRSGSFTPQEKAAIASARSAWEGIDHVTGVTDPFATQTELDKARTDLEAARTKLVDGGEQLSANRVALDNAQFQVAQGEGLITAVAKKNPKDPSLKALRQEVAAGRADLDAGEEKWALAKKDLEQGWVDYNLGKAQVDAMGDLRFVTTDGRFAVAQIQFDEDVNSVPYDVRTQIPELGSDLAAAGITSHFSSEIVMDTSLVGPGEIVGLAIALVVLLVMLGTLVAAGLPILGAILGVGVGLGGAMAATYFYEMNQMTPALALMLGLAVGIDYALFIVNRHRQMYLHGTPLRESIALATGTAGGAVTFAGATVIIALAALTLSGLPILAQMGLVAAATVAVSVLVAITVTPAMLRLIGPRVASRRLWRANGYTIPADNVTRVKPKVEQEEAHGSGYVRTVTRRPWLTIAGVVALVGVMAFPATTLRLGLPDGGSEPADSTAYATYMAIDENFGPGMNGPVLAVAHLDTPATDEAALNYVTYELTTGLAGQPGVKGAMVAGVSPDRDVIALQIVTDSGPADAETVQTVHGLQNAVDFLGEKVGADIGLTGQTVANIEISERLANALPTYLITVIGLSLIILLLVFRSVLVPIVATLGFLLSVAAAFGVTVAIYQWGWLSAIFGVSQPGPILSFMPIILIGVLFGLAMDYQMFLVSGMREAYVHGEGARRAVVSGFTHGAKVVTAAALIMFSVFGGFVFSHLTMIRPIGLGLAVGVIVDAMLVRMTLTPAIMHLLGERAWWLPAWLERLLPNVDVEGASLERHQPEAAPAAEAAEEELAPSTA